MDACECSNSQLVQKKKTFILGTNASSLTLPFLYGLGIIMGEGVEIL